MSEHPNSFELEAHFVGEPSADVDQHLEHCIACQEYIEQLGAERTALMAHESAADFLAREALTKALQNETEDNRIAWPKWLVFVPLGVAVATVLFVGITMDPKSHHPDEVTYKGQGDHLVILRDRSGAQSNHTKEVLVRSGDALRVQLTLAMPQTVLGGIVDPEGVWTPILARQDLSAGVHLVPKQAIAITPGPSQGLLIIGTPRQVQAARRGNAKHGALTIQIRQEPPNETQ